jgi:hypothetical protein
MGGAARLAANGCAVGRGISVNHRHIDFILLIILFKFSLLPKRISSGKPKAAIRAGSKDAVFQF